MYKQNLLEMTQINPRTSKSFSVTNPPKVPDMFAILVTILTAILDLKKIILVKLQDIFD